jgi:DNA-binding transcriptional LysR family regulator
LEALREDSADVALTRDTGPEEDLHIEKAFVEPFIAVLPRRHKLAALKSVPISRLRDEPFVFFPRAAGSYAWENAVRTCGFHPNIVQEAPQWLTLVRLVGTGLGVTIAPASVEQVASADVVCRRLAPSGGATSIDLVYRESSPLVKAFCEVAKW